MGNSEMRRGGVSSHGSFSNKTFTSRILVLSLVFLFLAAHYHTYPTDGGGDFPLSLARIAATTCVIVAPTTFISSSGGNKVVAKVAWATTSTTAMMMPGMAFGRDDIDLDFDDEEEEEEEQFEQEPHDMQQTEDTEIEADTGSQLETEASERDTQSASSPEEGKQASPPKQAKGVSAPRQFQPFHAWEYLGIVFVVLYVVNFFYGIRKNREIANAWWHTFQPLFEKQFSVIGEQQVMAEEKKRTNPADGLPDTSQEPIFVPESYHSFSLYASGRKNVIGCRVRINLRQRQDLFSYLTTIVYPQEDTITIEVPLSMNTKEPYVFAVVPSAQAKSLHEEKQDLSSFTKIMPEGRLGGPIGKNSVLTDCPELVDDLLHEQVRRVIFNNSPQTKAQREQAASHSKRHKRAAQSEAESSSSAQNRPRKPLFSMFHFTDDSAGAGLESSAMSRSVLYFKFKLPNSNDMDSLTPLIEMVFHYIDLVASTKLSREARKHVEKLRESKQTSSKDDTNEKSAHQLRMENAQKIREQKLLEQQEKMASMSPKEAAKLDEKLRQKNSKLQTKVVKK